MRILWSFMASALFAPAGWSGEWKLVWSDEFDRDGLPDPAKWAHEEGFVRNQELQYYTTGSISPWRTTARGWTPGPSTPRSA